MTLPLLSSPAWLLLAPLLVLGFLWAARESRAHRVILPSLLLAPPEDPLPPRAGSRWRVTPRVWFRLVVLGGLLPLGLSVSPPPLPSRGRAVLVVEVGMGSQAESTRGTRLERARREALVWLEGREPEEQVAVVAAGALTEVKGTFRSALDVPVILNGLVSDDGTPRPGEALAMARALGEAERVVLASSSAFADAFRGSPGVTVRCFGEPAPNGTVGRVGALPGGWEVELRARGGAVAGPVELADSHGKILGRARVSLEEAERRTLVIPGSDSSVPVTVWWKTGDPLPADDRGFWVPPLPRRTPLWTGPGPAPPWLVALAGERRVALGAGEGPPLLPFLRVVAEKGELLPVITWRGEDPLLQEVPVEGLSPAPALSLRPGSEVVLGNVRGAVLVRGQSEGGIPFLLTSLPLLERGTEADRLLLLRSFQYLGAQGGPFGTLTSPGARVGIPGDGETVPRIRLGTGREEVPSVGGVATLLAPVRGGLHPLWGAPSPFLAVVPDGEKAGDLGGIFDESPLPDLTDPSVGNEASSSSPWLPGVLFALLLGLVEAALPSPGPPSRRRLAWGMWGGALLLTLLGALAPPLPWPFGGPPPAMAMVDRSLSVGEGGEAEIRRALSRVSHHAREASLPLGMLAFGAEARLDRPPRLGDEGGFPSVLVSPSATDLASALTAGARALQGGPGRLLLFSDGRPSSEEGREEALAAAQDLARKGISLWAWPVGQVGDSSSLPFASARTLGVVGTGLSPLFRAPPASVSARWRGVLPDGVEVISPCIQRGSPAILSLPPLPRGVTGVSLSSLPCQADLPVSLLPPLHLQVRGGGGVRILASPGPDAEALSRAATEAGLGLLPPGAEGGDASVLAVVGDEVEPPPGMMERVRNGVGLLLAPISGARHPDSQTLASLSPLRAVERAERDRSPLLALLLVDVSGSMAGDGILAARSLSARVVKNLKETDHFGLLAFTGISRWVVPVQRVREKRKEMEAACLSLGVGGGTHLGRALAVARSELARHPSSRRVLVILSDGLSASEDAVNEATALREEGIPLVVVALGPHPDESLLSRLSARGAPLHRVRSEGEVMDLLLEAGADRIRPVPDGAPREPRAVKVTGEGRGDPLGLEAFSPWPRLTAWRSAQEVGASSQVLLETDEEFPEPLLARGRVGAASVLALTASPSAPWPEGFLSGVLRSLASSQEPVVEVRAREGGWEVEILSPSGEEEVSTSLQASVQRRGGGAEPVDLHPAVHLPGRWEGWVPGGEPPISLWLQWREKGRDQRASVPLRLAPLPPTVGETGGRGPDRPFLEELTAMTGGGVEPAASRWTAPLPLSRSLPLSRPLWAAAALLLWGRAVLGRRASGSRGPSKTRGSPQDGAHAGA